MLNSDPFGFKFRGWRLYKDAREFRIQINKILSLFPAMERRALIDQGKRAIDSIILNIAEGSNKRSGKERRKYIGHAHGSLDEVVSILDCAFDSGYINTEAHHDCLTAAWGLGKQMSAFCAYFASRD